MSKVLIREITFAVLIMTALAIGSVTTMAQGTCKPLSEFRDTLEEKYDEVLRTKGVVGDDGRYIIYTFVARDQSTWTALRVSPNKWACLVGAGKEWLMVTPDPELKGSKT